MAYPQEVPVKVGFYKDGSYVITPRHEEASDLEPLLEMDAADAATASGEKKPRKSALECWDSLKKYLWAIGRPRTCLGPIFQCPECSDFNYNNKQRTYFDGNYVWFNVRLCKACGVGNIRQQLAHMSDFPKKVWNYVKGGGGQ